MNFDFDLTSHPKIAFVVTILSLMGSYHVTTWEIPTICMQVVQLIAWGVTITAGIFSIRGFLKKAEKKEK